MQLDKQDIIPTFNASLAASAAEVNQRAQQ